MRLLNVWLGACGQAEVEDVLNVALRMADELSGCDSNRSSGYTLWSSALLALQRRDRALDKDSMERLFWRKNRPVCALLLCMPPGSCFAGKVLDLLCIMQSGHDCQRSEEDVWLMRCRACRCSHPSQQMTGNCCCGISIGSHQELCPYVLTR
jgi:hypothetical protein